jgi:hypothetical protein
VRRRAKHDPWPPHLATWREEDWPPVPGECLLIRACQANGYEAPCAPPPGRECGTGPDDFPDRPGLAAWHRRLESQVRWAHARVEWAKANDWPERAQSDLWLATLGAGFKDLFGEPWPWSDDGLGVFQLQERRPAVQAHENGHRPEA